MRRFATKLVTFIVLAGAMLTALSALSVHIRRKVLDAPVFFLGANVNTLVLGDSHPQASIDPNQWHEVANLCEGQENYLFTYLKFAFFLQRNPQISRVILGFSYHNLARHYQELFLTSEDESIRLLETYFVLLDGPSMKIVRTLTQHRKAYYLNLFKFKYGVPIQIYLDKDFLRATVGARIRREDVRFFGEGFHDSDRSNVDDKEMDAKARRYFLDERGGYSGVSTLMMDYLERLIRLSQARGLRLYLYNAPLHPRFKPRIPTQALADFAKARDRLLAEFPSIHYIDLVDEPLAGGSFGDGDHVNSRGAKVVTAKLASMMN